MTSQNDDRDYQLGLARLGLERARFRYEIIKWMIIAIGAVASFLVVDYGRLQIEKFRATTENERELVNAYLSASETVDPILWLRKLELIRTLSSDEGTRVWATGEISYIKRCAAKVAVYQETLLAAASLLDPHSDPAERVVARQRFEQLYWAELPYVDEGDAVIAAMIAFREELLVVDSGQAGGDRLDLNSAMIQLSEALRDDHPQNDETCRAG